MAYFVHHNFILLFFSVLYVLFLPSSENSAPLGHHLFSEELQLSVTSSISNVQNIIKIRHCLFLCVKNISQVLYSCLLKHHMSNSLVEPGVVANDIFLAQSPAEIMVWFQKDNFFSNTNITITLLEIVCHILLKKKKTYVATSW